MKLIGTSAAGNPMVEIEERDRAVILAAGAFLSSLPVIDLKDVHAFDAGMKVAAALNATRVPTPSVPAPVRATFKKKKRTTVSTADALGFKACVVCGTKFMAKTSAVTCSAECRKTRLAAQNASCREKMQKPAATAPKKVSAGDRLCAVCGKPMPGAAATQRVHPGECRAAKTRMDANKWYAEHKAKKPAAPASPPPVSGDPSAKAARLALIRQRARILETDDVDSGEPETEG